MSQFEHLKSRKNLYKAMSEVEKRIDSEDWDVAVQKMRTAIQELVQSFFNLYKVSLSGNLDDQINALKNAQLISPDSANAYHVIRIKGNRASHENITVSKGEALRLYGALVGEVILFIDKYSNEWDTDGSRALEEAMNGKPAKRQNRIIPSPLVRLIGIVYICFGVFFFRYAQSFMASWTGGNTGFEVIFPLICGLLTLTGLFSLATGNETLILINWILR